MQNRVSALQDFLDYLKNGCNVKNGEVYEETYLYCFWNEIFIARYPALECSYISKVKFPPLNKSLKGWREKTSVGCTTPWACILFMHWALIEDSRHESVHPRESAWKWAPLKICADFLLYPLYILPIYRIVRILPIVRTTYHWQYYYLIVILALKDFTTQNSNDNQTFN